MVVNGTTICSGVGAAGVTLEQGAVTTVEVITCKLPDLGSFPAAVHGGVTATPQLVELSCMLVMASDGTTVLTSNSWHSRLYPVFMNSPAPAPLYTTPGAPVGTEILQQCMFDNASPLPQGAAGVGANAVVLTDSLSGDVLAALANNATVVLAATSGQHLIPTSGDTFSSCWWLCGGNVGTVIYSHAPNLLAGMDQSGWADGNWQRMIDGSIAFVMESVNHTIHEALGNVLSYDAKMEWNPADATVHVRALPDILSGPRSSALLFELGTKGGKGGRLIASGLNLWPGKPNVSLPGGFEHPEKAYLLWKLLDAGFRGGAAGGERRALEHHQRDGARRLKSDDAWAAGGAIPGAVTVEPEDGRRATSALIFMHGLGGTGDDMRWMAEHLRQALPETRFIFPTAERAPITVSVAMSAAVIQMPSLRFHSCFSMQNTRRGA